MAGSAEIRISQTKGSALGVGSNWINPTVTGVNSLGAKNSQFRRLSDRRVRPCCRDDVTVTESQRFYVIQDGELLFRLRRIVRAVTDFELERAREMLRLDMIR